jgi:hypothetical protein
MEHVFLFSFLLGYKALERIHGFQLGDSTLEWKKKKWEDFKDRLSKVILCSVNNLACNILS